MEFKDFIQLVQRMREQQRVYFMTRSQRALFAAKELEKKVDNAITEILNAQDH